MMRNPLSKKITGIEPSGIRKFFDLVSEMPDAISLGVGEPDFDTPWRIREEGIYTLEQGKTFYTSNAGLKDLKIEISKYLERKIHVEYDPDHEIMVTVGGSEGIDVALRAMLDPGDEVLIPQPSYVSYLPCTILADGNPVIIPLQEKNEFKLTAEELDARCSKYLLVRTDNDRRAVDILRKMFPEAICQATVEGLRLFPVGNEAAATASGVLMENGLHVQELAVRSEGLEAYFTALVGGDSHADAG